MLEGKVAEIFYAYFSYKFIWNDDAWYYFEGHNWKKDKNGEEVMTYLVKEFPKFLIRHRDWFNDYIQTKESDAEKESNKKIIAKFETLMNNLFKRTFKNLIHSELKRKYRNQYFESRRDENPNILVCSNCVLEFVQDKIYSRDGLPEDFTTYSTKIRYLKKRNTEPQRRSMIRTYINQIYPYNDVRNWMWLYFTSGLRGGIPDKNFVFLQGRGDDSKSMLIKLLSLTFGDYLIIGKNEEILANVKANASGPEPEKIRKKGRRWCVYQELDSKNPLDGGKIRSESGGDNHGGARDLHKGADSMTEFKQSVKSLATFNREPPWAEGASVDATWKRVQKIPHYSRWVENAPETFKEQWEAKLFKLDENFGDVLPELAETFLSMLVSTWNQYYNKRLPKSERIRETTANWRKKCDLYHLYCEERIEFHNHPDKTPDLAYKKSIPQLYQDFTNWYRLNFSGSKVPNRIKFEEEMLAKLQVDGKNFIGISVRIIMPKKKEIEEEDGELVDEAEAGEDEEEPIVIKKK
jgi:phage/plasmid-associated DNA primase